MQTTESGSPKCTRGQWRRFDRLVERVGPWQSAWPNGPSAVQTWDRQSHCSRIHPVRAQTRWNQVASGTRCITHLVVVGVEVREVPAGLGVLNVGTKRGNKIPEEDRVVDVRPNLELRCGRFLGEDVDDLASVVCPLLGVGKDIVARVRSSQSGVVVVVDLNSDEVKSSA